MVNGPTQAGWRGTLRDVKSKLLATQDLARLRHELAGTRRELDQLREAVGRIESRQIAAGHGLPAEPTLADHGFRAFSQFDEDGILRHLTRHVPMPAKRFVEFGVESFREANCRWLMASHDAGAWSGLVIDGSGANLDAIRRDRLPWMFGLTAVESFVTAENINALIRDNGFAGDLGILSIDIDGVDYWVWRAIDAVRPAVVSMEYNCRFGPTAAVTVPYDPSFDRRSKDPSLLYFGVSLTALERLGKAKGYDLVGCGAAGLNAFFVRSDLRPDVLPAVPANKAWRMNGANELHDPSGQRLELPGDPIERMRVQRDVAFSHPLVQIGDDGEPAGDTKTILPDHAGSPADWGAA